MQLPGVPLPTGFLLGTANADHQVEAHDPAREDVWDLWERCQGLTPRGRATNFQARYEEDIAAAAAMGLKLFRFSISWARVEPAENQFDESEIAHYRKIARCIRAHGMQVMVTLHHFVWPIWLERDHEGMPGAKFPDFFARYAGKISASFGDIVDWWITFNEPSQLTFGYIKPWWRTRYYMPPGLPAGSDVEAEARAVGKLVPNLFRAHARARLAIRASYAAAKVGVNPLVTGFPGWLQKLMDWAACHRGMGEAMFKFTNRSALISEPARVDLVIAAISETPETRFETSDPYLITRKAVVVPDGSEISDVAALAGKRVGTLAIGNLPSSWERDLPAGARKILFRDFHEARAALAAGKIEALYGDAVSLTDGRNRFLDLETPPEHYVAMSAHGHRPLMEKVNAAISRFHAHVEIPAGSGWIGRPDARTGPGIARNAPRPVSLHEAFGDDAPEKIHEGIRRGLKRVLKRGKIRIGMRTDAHELEHRLAREIAREVMGDEAALEIVPLAPADRLLALESKTRWFNWAWRFWGSVSLISNSSWWYLGISGRLPEELCPAEAVGAQDFVGLDYYWGLPTTRLHQFRLLEEAALGKFLRAPVWPRGLLHALRRLHRWFPGQELFIVENGCVPHADGIDRSEYFRRHLAVVERAVSEGVPVKGFNCWSITSNREWGHPFDPNTDFGLYFVDLDKDPALVRKPTPEVAMISEIAKQIR